MVSSDSSGRFVFEDVEPRTYRLTFQKAAYETETREVNASDDPEIRVEMRQYEPHEMDVTEVLEPTELIFLKRQWLPGYFIPPNPLRRLGQPRSRIILLPRWSSTGIIPMPTIPMRAPLKRH